MQELVTAVIQQFTEAFGPLILVLGKATAADRAAMGRKGEVGSWRLYNKVPDSTPTPVHPALPSDLFLQRTCTTLTLPVGAS